jgi:hypothetical protein
MKSERDNLNWNTFIEIKLNGVSYDVEWTLLTQNEVYLEDFLNTVVSLHTRTLFTR